jgi:hypothetical protein
MGREKSVIDSQPQNKYIVYGTEALPMKLLGSVVRSID